MKDSYKNKFLLVAQRYTCWIGLRQPNPLAERWIGDDECAPKGLGCKAKTADNPDHHLGGLVVDPVVCPDAFLLETFDLAVDTWEDEFAKPGGDLPNGFSVVETGPEKGLVKQQGVGYLYADFDLMAVLQANRRGERLYTKNWKEKQLFKRVSTVLNQELGIPMVQHGTEFMWKGGIGAREREFVFWFGPGRRFETHESSMPPNGY